MKNNLGIYIHIPYCKSKCNYCSFISICNYDSVGAYISSLKKEIEMFSKINSRVVDSIYIGGGTPSSINEDYIIGVLSLIRNNYIVTSDCEITIECNPESIDSNKLFKFKESGVNRLSFGFQSSNNKILKLMNRPHNKSIFIKSVKLAKEYGFTNINADLIISYPDQNIRNIKKSIKTLKRLKLAHISVYDLIVEKNTKLYKQISAKKINMISEKTSIKHIKYTNKALKKYNYKKYEVSNFSLKGLESNHNKKYWNLKNYVGFGAAAHSNIGIDRWSNTEDINKYIKRINNNQEFIATNIIKLSKKEKMEEFIMLGLRQAEGINISEFKAYFGYDILLKKQKEINYLVYNNLVRTHKGMLSVTDKGFFVLNKIIEKILF